MAQASTDRLFFVAWRFERLGAKDPLQPNDAEGLARADASVTKVIFTGDTGKAIMAKAAGMSVLSVFSCVGTKEEMVAQSNVVKEESYAF